MGVRRHQYGIRFRLDLMQRVDRAAERGGLTRTALLEILIEDGLDRGLPTVKVHDERLSAPDRIEAFRRAAERAP